ncbi:hypothetical protein BN7_1063 [Wickerhamomyces ciferrii]|uniref:Homologous-pairing protein 2 winged helix domain-containing protein n=1 Tax=Wickerhamomyces ciferrii (strain ATCC 14091 / BCRC 22168 / CBS 111 / JCM 3599 / NBRC 0793 / NRRL Y-1031 F-60-10) TaxID=1206466 RepID=K0KH65_WICCF|nr:uncharacterized protein BN7_1063 [Wickerhamomyces ciferrii]CCH41522.1 hypothetical protein BN7_1063 [Wickerhamomyces ciferrii]
MKVSEINTWLRAIVNISNNPLSAEKVILEYLEQQYRPYTVNDIVQNLHGAIGKSVAQRALETLAEEGKIVTKQYGKITVSVANQVEVVNLSDIIKIPTDEDLDNQLETLKRNIETLNQKIDSANDTPSLSSESVEKIQSLSQDVTKESKKRVKLVCIVINFKFH